MMCLPANRSKEKAQQSLVTDARYRSKNKWARYAWHVSVRSRYGVWQTLILTTVPRCIVLLVSFSCIVEGLAVYELKEGAAAPYLLSNYIWIVAGLGLEGAVVGPKIR
jgi:hypothetical protein